MPPIQSDSVPICGSSPRRLTKAPVRPTHIAARELSDSAGDLRNSPRTGDGGDPLGLAAAEAGPPCRRLHQWVPSRRLASALSLQRLAVHGIKAASRRVVGSNRAPLDRDLVAGPWNVVKGRGQPLRLTGG